jgi:hypothetical protein
MPHPLLAVAQDTKAQRSKIDYEKVFESSLPALVVFVA